MRAFNPKGHLVGCSEWARLWIRHWGARCLDRTSRKNLDDMKRRGRAICCRGAR